MTKKYVYKILVAGQGGVGKTTLLTRIVTGKFVQNTAMTIGVEFHLLNLTLGSDDNSVNTVIQLWDFGGQERFRFMLDSYVAGARGALLLYDMTRLRTLDGLDEWVKIVRTHDPDLPILFVGTKLDRVEDITVSDDYAKEFLEPLNMFDHMKISSKDGTGVEKAFKKITREVLRINGIEVPPEESEIQPESQPDSIPAPAYEHPTTPAPVYEPPTTPAPVYEPPTTPAPAYEPPTIPAPAYEPPVIEPTQPFTQQPTSAVEEEKKEEEKKKPKKDPEEDLYSYFTKSSD